MANRYRPSGSRGGGRHRGRDLVGQLKQKPKMGLGGMKAPKPKLVGTARPGSSGLGARGGRPVTNKPSLGAGGAKPAVSKPKPVVGQKPEFDSAYFNAVDTANNYKETQLGALGNQRGDIRRDFGIDDPTDPFSRANGLKSAFLSRRKAASASLASQGQLYSGAHERALSRTRREEEAARADLRKAYDAALGQVDSAENSVIHQSEEAQNQAFEDWLARAPEAEVALDDPVAAPPAAAPKPNQAQGQGKVAEPVVVNPGGQAQVGSGMKPQVGSGKAQDTAGNRGQGAGSINQKDKARARRQRERRQQLRGRVRGKGKVGLPGGKPVKVRVAPKPKARGRKR